MEYIIIQMAAIHPNICVPFLSLADSCTDPVISPSAYTTNDAVISSESVFIVELSLACANGAQVNVHLQHSFVWTYNKVIFWGAAPCLLCSVTRNILCHQSVALYADVNGRQFPVTRGQDVGKYQVGLETAILWSMNPALNFFLLTKYLVAPQPCVLGVLEPSSQTGQFWNLSSEILRWRVLQLPAQGMSLRHMSNNVLIVMYSQWAADTTLTKTTGSQCLYCMLFRLRGTMKTLLPFSPSSPSTLITG